MTYFIITLNVLATAFGLLFFFMLFLSAKYSDQRKDEAFKEYMQWKNSGKKTPFPECENCAICEMYNGGQNERD